ncbi:hypothetical protein IEZ26_01585 [Nocardioides cavernae]|uniref:ATP-binding protein n=1 Tax=Nocardioides cavernae TaxID=1921566 RepID=A0ABR8N554_9ACTN|nr:hypothetical protein [Nocardioides cavernae]MBD3923298.1 hypothetical protein [Nocardioides cavernae]MBM7511780.1 hypothetical protein [Nocardioides cavernae]
MTALIDLKAPRERFARSVNVERDSGSHAIDGYLPVGRAIDSVDRLATAMLGQGEVALSVTGPYGTGKSSLALWLDCLFAPSNYAGRKSAEAALTAAAPKVMESVAAARSKASAEQHGFVRAVVTAQREPIANTVLRALEHGLSRYSAPSNRRKALAELTNQVSQLRELVGSAGSIVETRQVRDLIRQASAVAPLLIIIDEFGKNLEAFVENPGNSDLFLLQELAEWTRSAPGRHPVALVTMQHMAFGDYAVGTSGVQRREWMKIQGRFEDIPFVDTPTQTRALIAAAFDAPQAELANSLSGWADTHSARLREIGLSDLAESPDILSRSWPLHPLALAVLPALCNRYGQNERTMFSFLASREPMSVGRFLQETTWETSQSLPAVGLDRLYDYFIDSASNMVGISADASRWIEIDTRIRDARDVTDDDRRLLKTIGVLNLTSTGGSLRASEHILEYADSNCDTSPEHLKKSLRRLIRQGLITYRDFADEYRVWQGSDFDIKTAVENARRRLRDMPDNEVLTAVLPLSPVVAARHSHQRGTLRAFERTWIDARAAVSPLTATDRGDGLVAYVVGGQFAGSVASGTRDKPIVLGEADSTRLADAAREVLALRELLTSEEVAPHDWVVRKELNERLVVSLVETKRQFEAAYGPLADVSWSWVNSEHSRRKRLYGSLPAVASVIADQSYSSALPLRNDLINRHELSSQAAKARREVAEIMQARQHLPALGLEGFGPDRTLYLSLLSEFGIHQQRGGQWMFASPEKSNPAYPVWDAFVAELRQATGARLNVGSLFESLSLPPFGLRAGVAPLVLIAVLCAHSDEFAMYEHGTFRPRLGADLVERLLRNPGNFEVKCFGTRSKPRREFIEAVAQALDPTRDGRPASVVSVVSSMVAQLNMLTQYAKKTKRLSEHAMAVRLAILEATEPDELLFGRLPTAVAAAPVGARDEREIAELEALARSIASSLGELSAARARLSDSLASSLAVELKVVGDPQEALSVRSQQVHEKILDPRLKGLSTALQADMDGPEWLDYVAMQVVGSPPDSWGDDEAERFHMSIRDLGMAFLRIEALTADMRAGSGDFEALRIAVNSSRGGDLVRLVQLDDQRADVVAAALEPAMLKLINTGVSETEAREWILAHLLEAELSTARDQADVRLATYGEGKTQSEERHA